MIPADTGRATSWDFFNYEAENLTITSWFATAQNDYFLNYLLARVLRLPAVFHGFVPAEAQDHLLDMLPYVFAAYLREAMRKGPYRCYVETIERDSNVRGRIDLNSQIQTGNWYDGKIVYRRRELVADNFVMQLVRLVIDQLAGRKSLVPLLQTIRPEVAQVRELTSSCPGRLSRLIYQNLQRPVRHAYYHEYRQLQRLAILIATHRSALLGAGNRRLMGVAFDGASLWEEYLAQILPAGFEHPNNRLQKGGRPLFEEYQSGSRIGRVYPDYIGSVDHRAVVADAKYKPMGNIGGDDYFLNF
uniref:McrC family protein n=1 Tax=Lacticaseibacillus camelliae TaxID=381742 RepID=UPI000A5DD746